MNLGQPINTSNASLKDILSLIEEKLLPSKSMTVGDFMFSYLNIGINHDSDKEDDNEIGDEDERPGDNRNSGVIRTVSYENFRGAHKSKISLGPGLNIFMGENGAGKSSTLNAILIGLGCKGLDIGDGYILTDDIDIYGGSSNISVELDNTGPRAYNHDSYGDIIKITRTLTKNGKSSFRTYSKDGDLISDGKSAVDEIVKTRKILISNPLCVLTQEKIKEIQRDFSGKRGFSWFIEGTSIDTAQFGLQASCDAARRSKENLDTLISKRTDDIIEVENAKKALITFETKLDLSTEIKRLTRKILWAEVDKFKRSFSIEDLKEADFRSKMKELLDDVECWRAENDLNSAKLETLLVELKDHEEKIKEAKKDFADKSRMLLNSQEELKDIEKKLGEVSEDIEEFNARIKSCTDLKNSERDSILAGAGMSKENIDEELRKLTSRISDTKVQNEELVLEKARLELSVRSRDLVKQKIHSVNASIRNKYLPFGKSLVSLMAAIEKDSAKWLERPFGPVGCYVSVKEDSHAWKKMIIAHTQSALSGFVVSNVHDLTHLKILAKNCHFHGPVFKRTFQSFELPDRVPENYSTILDLLVFDDERAKVVLVDRHDIEKIIVCGSLKEAKTIVKTERNKPVVYLHDDQNGNRVERSARGAIIKKAIYYSSTDTILAGQGGRSLNTDLELLQTQMRKIKIDSKKIEKLEQRIENGKKKISQFESDRALAKKKIPRDLDSVLEVYAEEIQSLKLQLREASQVHDQHTSLRRDLHAEITRLTGEKDISKTELSKAKKKKEADLREQRLVKKRSTKIKLLIETKIHELESQKEKLLKLQETKDEKNRQLSQLVNEALAHCARSDAILESSESIEKLKSARAMILRDFDDLETLSISEGENLRREIEEAEAKLSERNSKIADLKNRFLEYKAELTVRFMGCSGLIRAKLKKARRYYRATLLAQKLDGRLEFDFDKSRVKFSATGIDSEESSAQNSLSQTDERFVTVIFMLSMWKILSPIFCAFDEADQGMDLQKRNFVIHRLIEEVNGAQTQAIICTPQQFAIPERLRGSNLKLHNLASSSANTT